MGQAGNWQKGNQLPVSGMLVPTPLVGELPLEIDLRLQFSNATRIRITVDITEEQADDPLYDDGILYCTATDPGLTFVTGNQFDTIYMLPDIIGVGFSVNEAFNHNYPYLYITSRNGRACDVRIRAI